MIYGYARISRKTQNIERQVRNISDAHPDAIIFKEAFTGTKILGRKELDKILKLAKAGDLICFDSASRMSRNEEEAVVLYEDLFNKNIKLEFLKEPHINTDVYKKALENQIQIAINTGNKATDIFIQSIIEALNTYTVELAKEQIRIVFAQAQKEVDDLHKRTSEGMLTAKLNGKRVGLPKGTKLITKRSLDIKKSIIKYSRDFNGFNNDLEVMKIIGVSRNTYYKYKKELKIQLNKITV